MHPLKVGRRYCLRVPGGCALGHVFIKQMEDGWAEGPFTPTPDFEPFRELFERESRLRRDQVIPLWEETADAIEALGIEVLEEPTPVSHRGLRVFVEGNEATIGDRQEVP
jgi:hypothetical protein